MAQLKTKLTNASVDDFLDSIEDEQKRDDCRVIASIMEKATRSKPKLWGASIVGFGTTQYKYASGREATWMLTAFSPRKNNITLYVYPGFDGRQELLDRLGTHKCGKGCVYIKRLSDIHMPTLKKLVTASVQHMIKAQAG